MPKQFCIKWGHDNRVETEIADFANLLPSLFQKVTRVMRRSTFRRGAIIQLFVIPGSGDPVVLHTREFSASPRNWPQMLRGKIKTDVAVEIAVHWISRIAFMRAPDLSACVRVAGKSRRPRRRIAGSINRPARARSSMQQAVCVQNEPTNICLL